MAEHVETGGVMKFNYPRGYEPKANEKMKKEIEEAYRQADERKKREKRKKIIKWIIICAVIVLIVIAAIFLRKS